MQRVMAWAAWGAMMGSLSAAAVRAEDPAPGSYASDHEFLKKHVKAAEKSDQKTALIELADPQRPDGPRVLVSPVWQGRVMTSTARGNGGTSFGWLNRPFIEKGQADQVFNNYGGEDRFWLAPEAGQFAVFFAPGAEQKLPQWITPPGLNAGEFQTSGPSDNGRAVAMHRQMQLENASGTRFHLEVERSIRLANAEAFRADFGEPAEAALRESNLPWVGFASESRIINRGPAWTKDRGLLSLWMLGQFKPGPKTVIILPFLPGPESQRGPVVNTAYFQALPPERLKIAPGAVLFLGDAQYRSKIGLSPRRARPVAAAIDLEAGVLTLVHYSLGEKPAEELYVDNLWNLPQSNPFSGDVVNSYNDGPTAPGEESLGGFFELETLSATRELAPGDSLVHVHATYHIEGKPSELAPLAAAVLGVDLAEVQETMFP